MLCPDVPVMNSNLDKKTRQILLDQIRQSNARRIWIALDRISLFDRKDHIERLSKNLRFFEENGFETGVWVQAFGFGDSLSYDQCAWTRIRSVSGVSKEADAFCPEDPNFLSAYLAWIQDIARLHPNLIMLDDDLCLSVRPGIGCFCDRHLNLLQKELKEPVDLTQIFVGKKNKYRDAWHKVMGDSLRNFCRNVRVAVDEIDPTLRVGHCAGYTSWDMEGTDPLELARILAGNTKPFYRLTGAPYWVATNRFPGQRLSAIIENARNQIAWSKNTDIEYFAEADSYPRPCYRTPAMLVENFDIVMHATGTRSLKYLFDYYSSPRYEKQYLKIHCRNLSFYETVEKAFRDAVFCGIRVYRPYRRITQAHLPESFAGEKAIMRSYFSDAANFLSCHAIPVSYGGDSDYAAVFGDDALYFEDVHKKVVLDLPAALILQERGFDVGIDGIADAPHPSVELFEHERVHLKTVDSEAKFMDLTLKEGAIVRSRYDTNTVASFEYNQFLVLNFDSFSIEESNALYCSYERGRQLQKFFENPYPAIYGYANLYSLCAKRDGKHIVLFQNHSIDPVFDFDIVLPKACKSFRIFDGEGESNGNKIHITTDFFAQGSLLLEVEYEENAAR